MTENNKEILLKKVLEMEETLNQIKKQLHIELNAKCYDGVNDQIDGYMKFKSYSINVDENDYEKIYTAAHKKHTTISKFIKNEYWEHFIHGGPNVYNAEYKYMLPMIANRRLSGGKKSIAFALNQEEDKLFDKKLTEWGIDLDKKRDILKFFVTQFLYGSRTINEKNNMKWETCNSSNIQGYSYKEDEKELYVMFKNGAVYSYFNVPKSIYLGLKDAESKGKYHSANIKTSFEYKKINI